MLTLDEREVFPVPASDTRFPIRRGTSVELQPGSKISVVYDLSWPLELMRSRGRERVNIYFSYSRGKGSRMGDWTGTEVTSNPVDF